MILVAAVAYAGALVAAFRWGRWTGVTALLAAVALVEAAAGTWVWARPHRDASPFPRAFDWQCHSVAVLPAFVILTAAGALALRLSVRSARGWTAQLGAVLMAFTLAAPAVLVALLYWGIDVWNCDTL